MCFFFGVTLGLFLGGLACVFFGLALLGRDTLDLEPCVFDGAVASILLGAFARLFFMDARIGQGLAASHFLFIGQLAKDNAGARRVLRGRLRDRCRGLRFRR